MENYDIKSKKASSHAQSTCDEANIFLWFYFNRLYAPLIILRFIGYIKK